MCHLARLIISNPSHAIIEYTLFRVQKPRSRQLVKFLSQIDKDILSVAAMLPFLALVQHTHALARTHSFFPSTRCTTAAANFKVFPVLRTDLESNDGFFRWVRWPRWSPSDFDIFPYQAVERDVSKCGERQLPSHKEK